MYRLWEIKNTVITPHVSGGFALQETYERIIRLSADNLDAFMNGKSFANVIDLSAGY